MAVVASLKFGDLPTESASLSGKRREKRPRGISFRNASNEGGWNACLPIDLKTKRLLKATEAKIAQPSPHEIACIARLQSPEIKLALSAR